MEPRRRVKLVRDGREQTLRIPRDLALPGDDAILRKEGRRLIIEPAAPEPNALSEYLDGLEPIDETFPEIDDPSPDPVEL